MLRICFVFIGFCFFISCEQSHQENLKNKPYSKEISQLYEKTKLIARTKKDSVTYYHKLFLNSTNTNSEIVQAMRHNVNGLNHKANLYFELAKNEHKQALQVAPKNTNVYADAVFELGVNYKKTANYKDALEQYFNALRLYKKLNFNIDVANAYAEIGEVYMMKNDSDLAKKYLINATKDLAKNKTNPIYLKASQTLANVYGMNGEFSKALEIDKEGINLSNQMNSDFFKVTFLNNKANCFLYSGQLDSAKVYFDKCLKIDINLKNQAHIADSYTNLSQWAFFSKKYPEAVAFMQKSIAINTAINENKGLYVGYNLLADIYSENAQPEKAFEAKTEALNFYKKLVDEKQVKSVSELEIVYQTEEKERLLLQKTYTEKKRNITILVLALVLLFMAVISYLIYKVLKNKNRQLKKEQELSLALTQIETQNKLQQQRLEISRDLHDNIGSQLTFIISSIDNLKYGFTDAGSKITNKLSYISNFTKDTIYELRDTIWAMNKDEITVEDLNTRISNFITNANLATAHIDFSFKCNLSKDYKTVFNSKTGMNIYRIIQEAVNNAIKHAEASKIEITISSKSEAISISIKDNGKGFESTQVKMGNGLESMQKRAEELDATLDIKSEQTGTLVKVNLT